MKMDQQQDELNTTTGTTTTTTLETTAEVPSIQGNTTTNDTSSSLSEKTVIKNYCDLCWRKDGAFGMILQTCCICNVSVHNQCYGIEGTEFLTKVTNWKCWACASIGLTIKTRNNIIDPITNERLHITVSDRPTECVLCNVDDTNVWYHAMHPLYDSPGIHGRQIVIPADTIRNKPLRLAWVHTLCAYGVNNAFSTTGAIYGCTQDGQYNCDDNESNSSSSDSSDSSDSNENGSINSYLNDKNVQDDLCIHHFVFDGPIPYVYNNNTNTDNNTTIKTKTTTTTRKIVKTWHDKAISDFQQLKCHICGSDDTGSLRVPVQCCANDKSEYKQFRNIHRRVHGDESCFSGMHVGCAMWGKDDGGQYPSVRRVFYDPGNEEGMLNEKNDYILSNIMCAAHAHDLQNYNMSGCKRKDLRYPKDKISSAPTIISTTTTNASKCSMTQTKQKSNNKITRTAYTSKSEKKYSDWDRLSEVDKEESINSSKHMMKVEIKIKIGSSSKEDILNKEYLFKNRVKATYQFYEEYFDRRYGWDKRMVVQYFNIALNDILRNELNLPIDTDYDVLEFLPSPQQQRKGPPPPAPIRKNKSHVQVTGTNNNKNINNGRQIVSATSTTITTVADVHQCRNRPLPSIARQNILLQEKQIEKRKKKKQLQQKQYQQQQHLQEGSYGQPIHKSSSVVESNDLHANKRNVAHLSNSILSTIPGEWDVGIDMADTSSLSSTKQPFSHPFGHNPRKEKQNNNENLGNHNNNKTYKDKQQKLKVASAAAASVATLSVDYFEAEESIRERSLDDIADVEDDGLSLVMIPDSTNSKKYCDDIVLDILVQEMEYERKASSLLSGHDTFATDNTNTTTNTNEELLDSNNSLECILQSAKEKWKAKIINDVVGQSGLSPFSVNAFEQLWETTIVQRVYKALNYSPVPIDWTFLLDERNNPEKYANYFEQV